MKRAIIAAGTFAACLVTLPAFAVMQPVGSVDLWPVSTRAAVMYPANLSGDILALTARGNADVACRTVTATFGDGSSVEIFRGTLAPDDQLKVYLPGGGGTFSGWISIVCPSIAGAPLSMSMRT